MIRPLLVLRPEPGNSATAARALDLGLEPHGFPLFKVSPRPWHASRPDTFAGLLFTSANGVRCAGPGLTAYRHLPVYAVGEVTAVAAREAGFASVVAGDRDVDRLIAQVATLGRQSLLHLAGVDARTFDPLGIAIERHAVYESAPAALSAGLDDVLLQNPVALIHSPRAAERFAGLVGDRRHIALVAISQQAADSAGSGWEEVAIAAEPRDDAMLQLAVRLCQSRSGE